MTQISRTEDGSTLGPDGKLLYCSVERFKTDISEGDCCFICGAGRQAVEFNDEHILPNWILRHHRLHNRHITLPNWREHTYGTYTVPCCSACNSLLGRELEEPLCEVLSGGLEAVNQHLTTQGSLRVFVWLALIFLKIHLKDARLRHHPNFNHGDATIAQEAEYEWESFHHIHALARSPFTRATISTRAFGSLLTLPAAMNSPEPFDLIDLSAAQTMAIRLKDVAICVVFNDACAVLNGLYESIVTAIDGPLSPVQIREVVAHFAACNMHLLNRPSFATLVRKEPPHEVMIDGHHESSPRFAQRDKEIFGGFLHRTLQAYLPNLRVSGLTPAELESRMLAGDISFLLDDDGSFIKTDRM